MIDRVGGPVERIERAARAARRGSSTCLRSATGLLATGTFGASPAAAGTGCPPRPSSRTRCPPGPCPTTAQAAPTRRARPSSCRRSGRTTSPRHRRWGSASAAAPRCACTGGGARPFTGQSLPNAHIIALAWARSPRIWLSSDAAATSACSVVQRWSFCQMLQHANPGMIITPARSAAS